MESVADYRFVEHLGEVGHGTLYLAHMPPRLHLPEPLVGVKVFAGASDEDTLRRVTRELRAFAAVDSPFIVRLLDAGRDGDVFFYAMEHCPGGSLQRPTAPIDRVSRMTAVAEAARGAHALHLAGLVHRGINPGSVLLTDAGARLADLGLAQVVDPTTSVTGLGPSGAVAFIDPAVISGEKASPASDVWSLGATLHAAMTGVGVYGELPVHDPLLAVHRILTQGPELSTDLHESEADLVERCLAEDIRARPASALAVADEIAALTTRVRG